MDQRLNLICLHVCSPFHRKTVHTYIYIYRPRAAKRITTTCIMYNVGILCNVAQTTPRCWKTKDGQPVRVVSPLPNSISIVSRVAEPTSWTTTRTRPNIFIYSLGYHIKFIFCFSDEQKTKIDEVLSRFSPSLRLSRDRKTRKRDIKMKRNVGGSEEGKKRTCGCRSYLILSCSYFSSLVLFVSLGDRKYRTTDEIRGRSIIRENFPTIKNHAIFHSTKWKDAQI